MMDSWDVEGDISTGAFALKISIAIWPIGAVDTNLSLTIITLYNNMMEL